MDDLDVDDFLTMLKSGQYDDKTNDALKFAKNYIKNANANVSVEAPSCVKEQVLSKVPSTANNMTVYSDNGKPFEINSFLNNMCVRIVGSITEPLFYASDLALAMNIKKINRVIAKYDTSRKATMDQKVRLGVVLYKNRSSGPVIDMKIALLTRKGMFTLVSAYGKDAFEPFIDGLMSIFANYSMQEATTLAISTAKDFEALNKISKMKGKELKAYKKKMVTIYVTRRKTGGNPYDYIPFGVWDEFDADAYSEYVYKFCKTPKKDSGFTDYCTIYGDDDGEYFAERLDDDEIIPTKPELAATAFYTTNYIAPKCNTGINTVYSE